MTQPPANSTKQDFEVLKKARIKEKEDFRAQELVLL